ncbi:MAG TPA: macro domain-containing protein [Vicinamibacterales bacterium]|nr:macro domain-containing protein [Vicinamibacterales bacterium]
MIHYTRGNLLDAQTDALVNTVNEVGVMGKGIALMFSEAFPDNARVYEQAAKKGQVRVGRMLVVPNRDLIGPKWIVHFPTKKHWRNPSKLEWIREGLKDLTRVLREKHIQSVALPPLGCGNGGLEWSQVKREIEAAMTDLPGVDVVVYEPTTVYQNAAKRSGLEALTPARALIAELVRRYEVLGLECTNLEVQKLAWFLHRAIDAQHLPDPLKLDFSANRYGPYADKLRHLLDGLDGSYLHCEKRLSDAGPLDRIWFEDSKRDDVDRYLGSDEGKPFRPALERTAAVIDGFESPLGMELLATIDWMMATGRPVETVDEAKEALQHWPGGKTAARRKLKLFDGRLLGLAINRLSAAR